MPFRENPGRLEESGKNIVLWPTEIFTEQCLKSTRLNMPHSEMLPENSLEYKNNMAVIIKQIWGTNKYSAV